MTYHHYLDSGTIFYFAQVNIPTDRQASLHIRYGAVLEDGATPRQTASGSVILDIACDGGGNLTVDSTETHVGPYRVDFGASATTPAVLSIVVADYSGDPAIGGVRIEITDVWGNPIQER